MEDTVKNLKHQSRPFVSFYSNQQIFILNFTNPRLVLAKTYWNMISNKADNSLNTDLVPISMIEMSAEVNDYHL